LNNTNTLNNNEVYNASSTDTVRGRHFVMYFGGNFTENLLQTEMSVWSTALLLFYIIGTIQ